MTFQYFSWMLRFNNRRIAELNAERDDPVYRGRASRLQKWKELAAQAQADLELGVAPPERLMYFASTYFVATSRHLHLLAMSFFTCQLYTVCSIQSNLFILKGTLLCNLTTFFISQGLAMSCSSPVLARVAGLNWAW